jgi:mRNA interferase HicA
MKDNEFIRKLKRLAKFRNIHCELVRGRGKGSHSMVYFGDKMTVVRNLKDELKSGTLNAMLKQLDITLDDL